MKQEVTLADHEHAEENNKTEPSSSVKEKKDGGMKGERLFNGIKNETSRFTPKVLNQLCYNMAC